MAAHLGESRVRTGQPVTSVSLVGDVATVRRSSGERFTAVHVVMARPPPTMRDLRIDGPLPAELRQAIDSTVLDPITKVAIPYVGHPPEAVGAIDTEHPAATSPGPARSARRVAT